MPVVVFWMAIRESSELRTEVRSLVLTTMEGSAIARCRCQLEFLDLCVRDRVRTHISRPNLSISLSAVSDGAGSVGNSCIIVPLKLSTFALGEEEVGY